MTNWPHKQIARPRSGAHEAYATTSWWTVAPACDFTRRAQGEVTRMSNSRLANGVDPVHGIKDLTGTGRKVGRRPAK